MLFALWVYASFAELHTVQVEVLLKRGVEAGLEVSEELLSFCIQQAVCSQIHELGETFGTVPHPLAGNLPDKQQSRGVAVILPQTLLELLLCN